MTTYALDTTGLSVNNVVSGESHPVTPALLANFGALFLNYGPFFGRGFSIIYTPTGGTATALVEGKDYQLNFQLMGFGNTLSTKVWGAVQFYNLSLNGTVAVTYQALGGNWTFNTLDISNYLNSNQFNGNTQFIALVPSSTLYLPTNPSVAWPLNSIPTIAQAQAQLPSIDLSVQYYDSFSQSSDTNPSLVEVTNFPANWAIVANALPLPANAAQETGGNLASAAAALGTPGDVAYTGTGNGSLVSLLKAATASLVATNATLATDYPNLPNNAAQEQGGNLASIATSASSLAQAQAGTAGTGIAQPTGGSGLLGYVSGLYSTLKSMLSIFSLPLFFNDNALATIIDTSSTPGYVYFCEANPGTSTTTAGWRISQLNVATGQTLWAGGVGTFTNIAANRTSLVYS